MPRIPVASVLVLFSFTAPLAPRAGAQVFRSEASHLVFKAGVSNSAYVSGKSLGLKGPAAATIGAVAPTIVGKLMYAPKGLGGDQTERWPSVGFVAKDMVAEFAVQSGPLLIEWAKRDKSGRRWPLAVLAYAGLVRYVTLPLEVR